MLGALGVNVERIGVLHQKFARAHDAKARAHLVAELPLDMVEVERQVLVGAHIAPENLRHHLFVGGAEQHFALMPVLDAKHFLAVIVIAPTFAPQICWLNGRHEQFNGAGAILLLAHDCVDLVQHPQPKRQPGVNARRFLPQHARAQHQAVRDDLRLFGSFAQNWHEIAGKTHRTGTILDGKGASSAACESQTDSADARVR